MEMLIYTTHNTNRFQYICDFIFVQYFGLAYTITSDIRFFDLYNEPKIVYTDSVIAEKIQVMAHPLLSQTTIEPIAIATTSYRSISCPFAVKQTNTLFPFDIFSAIFYLVSRYEEYLPFVPNKYGQFSAQDAFAFKNNFLQQPIIDIWLDDFKIKLQQLYPTLKWKEKKFVPVITYDIDTAYAFKGKSRWLNFAGWCKDAFLMRFSKIKERVGVLFHNDPDPLDTYAMIQQMAKQFQYKPILFFLTGKRNRYNRNINPNSTAFKDLVQFIKGFAAIGIHPSYFANEFPALFQTEKSKLENIAGTRIDYARQHYLRLQFPDTYRYLIANGITNDYTMGFAEMTGFRASTCTPFYFFDLINNSATNLTIHPISFMEGSFAEDMRMTPAKALEIMKALLNEVKLVNGEFVCIWHNHTISNKGFWLGWKNVHDQIIQNAFQHG